MPASPGTEPFPPARKFEKSSVLLLRHNPAFAVLVALFCWLSPGAGAADDLNLCRNSARDPDASIPACTRLIEHGGADAEVATFLNDRGVAKAGKEDLDGALRDFSAALDKNPSNPDAIKNSGVINKLKGGPFLEEAIRDFTRAIRQNPKNPDLYNWRGSAHLDKDDLEAALNDFDRAVAFDAKFEKAYVNRGFTYYHLRNLERALADFDMAVRLDPKDPLGYSNRAMVRIDLADFKNAIADLDKALQLDGQNAAFLTQRGEAWRLQGNFDKALADHERSIAIKPNWENYNNRALVLIDQGKLDQAKADCSEAIILNPSYALAYMNRGLIRRLQGDLGGAMTDLSKAVSLSPRFPTALVYRGDTYREMGDVARALADLDEAVRIVPDYAPTYVSRGLTYERKGDFARARADYDKALSLPANKYVALTRPAQKIARDRLAILIEEDARRKAAGGSKGEPTLPQDPGVRLALVVGNSEYQAVPFLPNPSADAQAVAEALRKVGFKTIVTLPNATRASFLTALHDFGKKAEQADWAVIYYAGHGIVIDGENFLIPIDAKFASGEDVQREAIPLEKVLAATKGARRIRLVMLDACRDNPFLKAMQRVATTHTFAKGLASIEPEVGTLVAYATRDGRTAEDGSGEHSPFTQAFLNNIYKPGLEINMLFRKIHDEVVSNTGGRQEPFTYGFLPFQSFYFAIR
jgi:tetratricopeptide (TPR) repeat protein